MSTEHGPLYSDRTGLGWIPQEEVSTSFLDSQWGLSKFIAMKVYIFVIGWTRYGMAILGTFQQFFCRQKLSIRVRTCSDIRYVRNPYLSPLNVYIFVVQTGSFTNLNSVNMLTPLENASKCWLLYSPKLYEDSTTS